jgi:glycosyltransferase involved in cell wall biosynthesis
MIYNLPQAEQRTSFLANVETRVSVIIPCYNVEKLVARCIDSVLNQSIGREKLEIILVNDASTDHTLDTLKAYEQQYPEQILLVDCEQNGKQGMARNIGMTYATGEYTTFVDADDLIHEHMIEALLYGAVKYQTDIAECELQPFSDELPEETKEKKEQLIMVESEEERKTFFLINSIATGPCRRLYKTSFLRENRIHFAEGIYMEDICFSQSAIACCRTLYKTTEVLYYYYQNPNGTMHASGIINYYMDIFEGARSAIDAIKDRGMFALLEKELAYSFVWRMHDLYLFMTKLEPFPQANWDYIVRYSSRVFSHPEENPYLKDEEREFVLREMK